MYEDSIKPKVSKIVQLEEGAFNVFLIYLAKWPLLFQIEG